MKFVVYSIFFDSGLEKTVRYHPRSYLSRPAITSGRNTGRRLTAFALLLGLAEGAAAENPVTVETDAVELDTITVTDTAPDGPDAGPIGSLARAELATGQARSSDTASLFKNIPGVSLATGGGVASQPTVHGMADDRVKLEVNGMNITSACANHMNPALSYVAPEAVGQATVLAGITPVSHGGDSIGGTIAVDPLTPVFASERQGTLYAGKLGSFFRSNNNNFGNSASASIANQDFSLDYNGAWSKATNYHQGDNGPPVLASKFLSTNHSLRAAHKLDRGTLSFDLAGQYIPYEGFPNQRMDVTGNEGLLGGLNFENTYDWGKLDARVYYHYTWHRMDILPERAYTFGTMLMKTRGSDLGYRVRAHIPMGAGQTLRIGNEFFRQTLQDWWPGGSANPQDYLSVNDGQRNRLGTFAEWQTDWNPEWTTQIGARNDMVWMNTGRVHGYGNDPLAEQWSTPFNLADRARTDANFDITALARYTPNAYGQYELGFARKMRAPNLYERYAWNGRGERFMITWFGDGNGYQGNLDLKSETAYNFALTGEWHDAARETWSAKLSPYYTHVENYIWGQAQSIDPFYGFRAMNFINLPYADMYGVDASGRYAFLKDSPAGDFALRATLAYVRGVGQDGGRGQACPYTTLVCNNLGWPADGLQAPGSVNLYHMMPLHGSLTLEHGIDTEWGKFSNALGVDLVSRKTAVATTYGEPVTAGYALLNLQTSLQAKQVRLDLGVDNLLDKLYYHPLGGVYIDAAYAPDHNASRLPALPALGRSVYMMVNVEF